MNTKPSSPAELFVIDVFGDAFAQETPAQAPTHTAECIAATARAKQKRADWIASWPNHCRLCSGFGGDEGSREDPYFDPCPDCVCQNKCGRCGQICSDLAQAPQCRWCLWRVGQGAPSGFHICLCPDLGDDPFSEEPSLDEDLSAKWAEVQKSATEAVLLKAEANTSWTSERGEAGHV